LSSAVALMLGANIGTCITGVIASINSSLNSKRLSISQLTLNIFGILVFLLFFENYVILISKTSNSLPRQIANSHTIFNIICTLFGLLFLKYLIKLVKILLPGKEIEVERGDKYLDEKVLNIPSIAISQAEKNIKNGRNCKRNFNEIKRSNFKRKAGFGGEDKVKREYDRRTSSSY
jgi:phosphate:Na+ symporter